MSKYVAIPADRKVMKKQAEKIFKYKELTIEIQHICNVKAKMISIIIGMNETISKTLKQYLSNIQRKHEIEELQKPAILGTAHKLGKVLM
jgi:hypothetical protein